MKYADLIRAALDGKTIQYRYARDTLWRTFSCDAVAIIAMTRNDYNCEYRIKPEDRVYYDVVRMQKFTEQSLRDIYAASLRAGELVIVKVTISDDGTKKVELVP